MLSFRNKDAKWPFKSLLYCIMTALVTVSHLERKEGGEGGRKRKKGQKYKVNETKWTLVWWLYLEFQ